MSTCRSAVILAAGLGSRLGSAHAQPKGFISIGGESLIRRSLRLLLTNGVTDVLIVTGHLDEYYEDLKKDYPELRTIRNERYADSGSMYSLRCARDLISSSFLLLESDLIYERRALLHLQSLDRDDVVLLSGKTNSGDEVFVETHDGLVRRMSKKLADLQNVGGELTGISRFSPETLCRMSVYAERYFESSGLKLEYEHCINGIIDEGAVVSCERIDDLVWSEIDDVQHWNRVRTEVFPRILQSESGALPVRRNVLLNPGPATTTDTVKHALVVPDICHREKEFLAITKRVCRGLVDVVHGGEDYAAIPLAGSGTAAVESVIGSVVPQGHKLLIVENGAYGTRMRQMAQTLGIDAVVIECSPQEVPSLDRVDAAFADAKGAISHLAIVHHETTTGLLNPVRECAALARRYGAEIIVDAMSSYAGMPIDAAAWSIDYLVSSANKCLQGMAGISFVIASLQALDRAAGVTPRSLYLSLIDQHRALTRGGGEARFTPPVQLFYALSQALDEYFAETGERRHARYVACYAELLPGMKRLGFQPLLRPELHSKLLTTFLEPADPAYSFDAMHDALYARGFTIYPGKIAARNTFRIANIGAINPQDIRNFLTELESLFPL